MYKVVIALAVNEFAEHLGGQPDWDLLTDITLKANVKEVEIKI